MLSRKSRIRLVVAYHSIGAVCVVVFSAFYFRDEYRAMPDPVAIALFITLFLVVVLTAPITIRQVNRQVDLDEMLQEHKQKKRP